jgi:hypothetical protein
MQAALVREHGAIVLREQPEPDRGLRPRSRGKIPRADAEGRDAFAQKTPQQVFSHHAMERDATAQTRELRGEDGSGAAQLDLVVVDELLDLAIHRTRIAPEQHVRAQLGHHGDVEGHAGLTNRS